MDIDYITFTSKVSPISKRHDEGRTVIPKPVMQAVGMDIGDILHWTVNKRKKSIEIAVKKQVAAY